MLISVKIIDINGNEENLGVLKYSYFDFLFCDDFLEKISTRFDISDEEIVVFCFNADLFKFKYHQYVLSEEDNWFEFID